MRDWLNIFVGCLSVEKSGNDVPFQLHKQMGKRFLGWGGMPLLVCLSFGGNKKSMNERRTKEQWLVAWEAFKRLIADPSQTKEFFIIINALSGPSLVRGFNRFVATEHGANVITKKIDLIDTLKDHDYLRALPKNSLGAHYLKFVEAEKLKAEDIVEASSTKKVRNPLGEDLSRFARRQRDVHDVWHAVTQYGRDDLGELCLMSFAYGQIKNGAIGIVAFAGAFTLVRRFGLGVFPAVFLAYRDSKRAKWLLAENWEELIKLPISEVRAFLNVPEPKKYNQLLASGS